MAHGPRRKPLHFYGNPDHVTLLGVYTVLSSDRPLGPTIVPCKRPVSVRVTVRKGRDLACNSMFVLSGVCLKVILWDHRHWRRYALY